MTTPKEITATEKLLELIRASSSPPPAPEETTRPEPLFEPFAGLSLEDPEPSADGDGAAMPGADAPPPIVEPPAAAQPPFSSPPPAPIMQAIEPEEPGPSPLADDRAEQALPSMPAAKARSGSFLQASAKALKRSMQRLRPSTKTVIAIDIQPGVIRLVKTKTCNQEHTILSCQSVPFDFDPDMTPENLFDDQPFKGVLFSALSALIGKHESHEIWCSYGYCTPVSLHNVSIPKVEAKDIANAVFWSAKRELEFDETVSIFDYSILQEFTDGNQAKLQTLVTLTPRQEVKGVETMFRNAGFPLTGLTFPAAAIQNFLNHDHAIPADTPVVYFTIRKNSSFIDLFHQGKMFFSREIKTGVDSFIESLLDQALSQNILIDEDTARDYLFRPRDKANQPRPANDELSATFDIDGLAVIDRLVRQLVRTFEYCGTTFKAPPVSTIFTSGENTVNDTILQAIENRLGIKCAVIEPLSPKIFNLTIAAPPPNSTDMLVAAGLSLSDLTTTANFLYTYAERDKEMATNRVNAVIALTTICLTVGSGAFFAWEYNKGLDKKAKAQGLRNELTQRYDVEPRSRSNDYTSQTIQKIGQFHRNNREKIKRYLVVAMISELTHGIDPKITITDLTLDLASKGSDASQKKGGGIPGSVQMNGYINAPGETQEFILMNFLKTLTTLKLLDKPKLKSKERTTMMSQDVLRFEVNLKTSAFMEPPAS